MKVRTHRKYKLEDGTIVPSVTTALSILAKPALIHWAWDLGTKGIDYRKYRDDKAEIGTLVHHMILCDFKNKKPDLSDYSKKQIEQAETCMLKFWDWKKQNPIKPILVEESMVSEYHKYGGTLDVYGKLSNEYILADFKTGKGIYDEMLYQLAAYDELLAEHSWPTDKCVILRIGRDENEGFETLTIENLDYHFEIFLACLKIYNLKKKIKETP